MKQVLFIRSYERDIRWLQYCLRSIQKYVTGFDKIHVVVPATQKQDFVSVFPDVKACGIYSDDYLGQQATKLQADTYTGDDCLITFLDSDCCFNHPFNVKELLDAEGRPLFLKTPYNQVGDATAWKVPTEAFLQEAIAYEYMRRLPITVHAQHLKELRAWGHGHHGLSIDQYILQRVPSRHFSEFNVIGAWLDKHRPEAYAWIDTAIQPIPAPYLIQHWSWGGLTPETEATLERILA